MTAPDASPAITALLDQAAELATAANARLAEVLAIAYRGATRSDLSRRLSGGRGSE
jgi:hypothetical protein